MSQRADFKVVYDGPALRDHSMDVRDLAPALLSLGQMLDRANLILNDSRASIRLEVKALSAGSFEIDFGLVQSLYSQASQFLTGDFVESALNLKELIFGVGAGGYSLWKLYKFLKGRRPDKVENLGDGQVRLTLDGDVYIFPVKLLHLYEDMIVRRAVEDVVRPLEREGIDVFLVREGENVIASVTREERIYFSSQLDDMKDVLLMDREYEGVFAIVALTFKDDNKWRLSDGASTLNVAILDKEFLARIDSRGESFFKGDLLKCQIRTRQWETTAGLKIEHEVVKVIDHIQSGKQLKLFGIPFKE